MEMVNARKLRAELKDYLEHAEREPIRIQRRTSSFILMNEEHYEEMRREIDHLQRRLLGASQIIKGDVSEYRIGERGRTEK